MFAMTNEFGQGWFEPPVSHRLRMDPMRLAVFGLLISSIAAPAVFAHHPNRESQPVRERVDVIGPIGNGLPASYRRVYNRPTHLGGKIAYWIAPTSQEAMAWHHATHRGDYRCDLPRAEEHHFYPKPYEVMRIGSRKLTVKENRETDQLGNSGQAELGSETFSELLSEEL